MRSVFQKISDMQKNTYRFLSCNVGRMVRNAALAGAVCIAAGGVVSAQTDYNKRPEFLNANNNWVFGQGAGLSFSSGTAQPIQTSVTGNEGYAAVSDPATGALLFYTNGGSVWNASNQVMPNGTGLLGNSRRDVIYSSMQGACIVPVVGTSDKYYLFSLTHEGDIYPAPTKGCLFYSVVDMSLDNGNGDVETVRKNIILDTNRLSEAMIAIPGCNNDVWLVVHTYDQSATAHYYKAYHITEAGINPEPVVSQGKIKAFNSYMSVSPDRRSIVLSLAFSQTPRMKEFVKFDPATGIISDPVQIPSSGWGSWGGCFSPDNRKVYFLHSDGFAGPFALLQYDISSWDSSAIEQSVRPITLTSGGLGMMRLYNDTIYAVEWTNTNKIHRINQPNKSGDSCDFEPSAITLIGTNTGASLGTEVVLPIRPDTVVSVWDTVFCGAMPASFTLQAGIDSSGFTYEWSTGETTSSIDVSQPGTYSVYYTDGCLARFTDSFEISVSDPVVSIGVSGDTLYAVGGSFTAYQWYRNDTLLSGETKDTIIVTLNGRHVLEVVDEFGCSATAEYGVNNLNISTLTGNAIRIYPNPAGDVLYIQSAELVSGSLKDVTGRTLRSLNGSGSLNMSGLASGIYLLELKDRNGKMIGTERIVKQ